MKFILVSLMIMITLGCTSANEVATEDHYGLIGGITQSGEEIPFTWNFRTKKGDSLITIVIVKVEKGHKIEYYFDLRKDEP